MFATIDEFVMNAPYSQLQEILEKIKEGYEEQGKQYIKRTERLNKKKKNPQEFENEINRINQALEKYKLFTRETKENLIQSYSGRHSKWQKDIDELKVKYSKLIKKGKTIEDTRKHITDALYVVQDNINAFSKELTEKWKKALDKTGRSFKEKHKISIPTVDLDAIEEMAKDNAYRQEDVYEWRKEPIWKIWKWFNRDYKVKVDTRKVFDDEKYLENYRTICNDKFIKIANNLPNKSKEVLDIYLDQFSKEMDFVINERQKALDEEKNKKQSNDELIKEIEYVHGKKKALQPELKRIEEILEDIR